MKEKKRRFEIFSFYDHNGIEKHLKEMAKKGWLIESITNFYWTYRKIEPKDMHFTVTYYPKASEFAPYPSEKQQMFLDFCAQTGWRLACTWFQMQVFYNESENPIPIETDPVLEVENIHKGCKANFLRSNYLLLVLDLIWLYYLFFTIIRDPVGILVNPSMQVIGIYSILLLLHCSVELMVYYNWYRKAKKAAENNIFMETPSTVKLQRVLMTAVTLGVGYVLWNWILAQNTRRLLSTVLGFLCVGIAILFTEYVKKRLKREGMSSGTNRIITLLSCTAACFIMINVFARSVSWLEERGILQKGNRLSAIESLMQNEYDGTTVRTSSEESVFAGRLDKVQYNSEGQTMYYQVIVVKVPFFYDFCKNQTKQKYNSLAETDETLWGAEEAYCIISEDEVTKNSYLLYYPNIILKITYGGEPTREQMARMGEMFG